MNFFIWKIFLFLVFIPAIPAILANSNPNPKLIPTTCNILSFSGGGSFGAVEIGILDKIKLPKYDMITGISAGGLNAGLLSYYNSDKNIIPDGVEYLANIYFNLNNSSVYTHNSLQFYKTWSYYDTTPLYKTIEREIEKLTYPDPDIDPYITSKPTLIGSTNLNTGTLEIFQFEKQPKYRQKEILMATSAIPLIFPPQIINENYYVDGGVIANEIISGIESYLQCEKYNIKYNITFITSSPKLQSVKTINNFDEYIRRIGKVVLTDFNNELAEIISNPCYTKSKGQIHYCYPQSDELDNYSILDFSHGKELYNIGYNNFTCEHYNYC